MITDFNKIINDIQPLYEELNSGYSKSYLKGSSWYVGDDLKKWWENCNVRYFQQNRQKLVDIIEILLIYKNKNTSFSI